SDIQRDFHELPPSYSVQPQACCLRRRSSPTAEGTGTHNPIGAHHPRRPWWYGAPATRFSWRPPVWGLPRIQKDTGPQGLTAQPLRASPPRQPETVPTGTAKFVICDHTIEINFDEIKELGLGHSQGRSGQGVRRWPLFLCVAHLLLKFLATGV